MLRLLIQLYEEAFEMLTKSLFSFVDGRVEGLYLEAPLRAVADVVTKLPGKSLGAFYPSDGTVLIAFERCLLHRKTLPHLIQL